MSVRLKSNWVPHTTFLPRHDLGLNTVRTAETTNIMDRVPKLHHNVTAGGCSSNPSLMHRTFITWNQQQRVTMHWIHCTIGTVCIVVKPSNEDPTHEPKSVTSLQLLQLLPKRGATTETYNFRRNNITSLQLDAPKKGATTETCNFRKWQRVKGEPSDQRSATYSSRSALNKTCKLTITCVQAHTCTQHTHTSHAHILTHTQPATTLTYTNQASAGTEYLRAQ